MLHRVRSLVAVLMLGLPLAAAAQPARPPTPPQTQPTPKKAPAPPADPMGGYTYCDVKMLSVLWKNSISDAKTVVRSKVSAGSAGVLATEITAARTNAKKNTAARCNWDEAGLSYSDVEALAKAWKTTVAKAKVMIEDKIIGGGEKYLRDAIANAPAAKPVDPTTTFLTQDKYTYCDVKILSERWKVSAKDAKATIGTKIQFNADSYLRSELDAGWKTTKQSCSYTDGGFTFKDAQKLAKLWSITVTEAKTTIENKLKSGNSIYLKQEIRGSETDSAYEAFHKQTKYSYCDAHMIGQLWGKSLSDGKLAIGTKLAAKQTGKLTKLVGDARKNAKKNESARCSFYDAGFTYDDATILAKLWKKTEGDVKALVPEKIALGQEATIRAQLKKERAKQPKPAPQPALKDGEIMGPDGKPRRMYPEGAIAPKPEDKKPKKLSTPENK